MVLTQPVNRRTVYVGMFCGLGASLVAGFILGVGLPYLFFMTISQEQLLSLLLLLTVGSFLTIIFLAISFLLATILDDRGKGLAAILGVCFHGPCLRRAGDAGNNGVLRLSARIASVNCGGDKPDRSGESHAFGTDRLGGFDGIHRSGVQSILWNRSGCFDCGGGIVLVDSHAGTYWVAAIQA